MMSGSDIEQQLGGHEMEVMQAAGESSSLGGDDEGKWWSIVRTYILWIPGIIIFGGASLAVAVFLLVLGLPIIPLSLIIFCSLPKKTWLRASGYDYKMLTKEAVVIGNMYDRARRQDPHREWIMISSAGVLARASLGALVWLGLSLLVPSLKAVTLLGSPMWKWSLLGVTLTAGYFQVVGIVQMPLLLFVSSGGTDNSYYAEQLIDNTSLPYISLVLGTWLAYFRNGLNHHHHWLDHKAFDYVTWTFVSLFLGSILMLCKKLLLLKWSADAIYRRFEPRILITSLKFYFIGLLAAGFSEDRIIDDLKILEDGGFITTATASNYVMSRNTTLFFLDYLSRILIKLGESKSPQLDAEQDQEEVVTWFKQQINNDTSDMCTPDGLLKLFRTEEKPNVKGDVEQPKLSFWKRKWKKLNEMSDEDLEVEEEKKSERNTKLANILWRLVGEECSSACTFTFDHLKIWMVDSHKDCINMGRTLADAEAIVTRLDIFMSFVICVIVLLLWLLITGISSTTVLFTVATPFLALTFIFGDSAKIFFQGLMFYFATHPFDVGDRCILDEVELEVKRVSILTTKFIKVGSKEERLYPNSVLATKAIVNLGWQPDPKDMIELLLDPSTNLDAVKIKITEFFEGESMRYENTYNLMITEIGENIKVKIHFSHILTVHDLSHSQCFKKKSSQRSDFLYVIKKYLNELQMERMNAKDTSQSAASTTTREIIELWNKQK